ncbi:MAG TPA: NAD(P)-binding domain-containing protein [Actinomycetota bacterium]|nr:NAD(P)-binding domain-containing protein [Actinomycetota bacterium]
MTAERFQAVVIGGGQAGLSAGAYLRRAGRSFVILDGHERIGDNWRERYDSLRLFTPAYGVSLPFDRYRKAGQQPPTRDEFADYLEGYARRRELPVRNGVWVRRLSREGVTYVLDTTDGRLEAEQVIVASGAHRDPRVPAPSRSLDPAILQLHSSAYRNPSQIPEGPVLVVGVGNSGADISLDLAPGHRVWLSGPDRGHVPVDIDAWVGRHIGSRVVLFLGKHVATLRTPIGRRMKAKTLGRGDPLIRVKPKQILAAGVERVGRTVGVHDGWPVVEDGAVLDPTTVIWCTGFRHDLSWIDLPIFDEDGAPRHVRGVVQDEPGLAFVGLPFQFALGSDSVPGVGRDARYVVRRLARRPASEPVPETALPATA